MPVQAEAGLEPQGVACAEAGGVDGRVREQSGRDGYGVLGRHGELEAVLARVAASCCGNAYLFANVAQCEPRSIFVRRDESAREIYAKRAGWEI